MYHRKASLVLAALIVGCGGSSDSSTEPAAVVATALFPSTDLNVQVIGGTPIAVAVRATTSSATPAVGIPVAFAAGAGTLSASTAITDGNGIATVQWTSAKSPGAQTVTATVPGTFLTVTTNAIVSVPITGTWRSLGASPWVVSFTQNGDVLKYLGEGNEGTLPVAFSGTILGAAFQFTIAFSGSSITATYTGTIQPSGTTMIGTFSETVLGQLIQTPMTFTKDP